MEYEIVKNGIIFQKKPSTGKILRFMEYGIFRKIPKSQFSMLNEVFFEYGFGIFQNKSATGKILKFLEYGIFQKIVKQLRY